MRWEYCRLVWSIRKVESSESKQLGDYEIIKDESAEFGPLFVATFGTLRFLGSGRNRQRITDVDQTIAELGAAGWELVSHSRDGENPSTDTFYFKRPAE